MSEQCRQTRGDRLGDGADTLLTGEAGLDRTMEEMERKSTSRNSYESLPSCATLCRDSGGYKIITKCHPFPRVLVLFLC